MMRHHPNTGLVSRMARFALLAGVLLSALGASCAYSATDQYLGDVWGVSRDDAIKKASATCTKFRDQLFTSGVASGLSPYVNQSLMGVRWSSYIANFSQEYKCGVQFSNGGWNTFRVRAHWDANGCTGYVDDVVDKDDYKIVNGVIVAGNKTNLCYSSLAPQSFGSEEFSCKIGNPIDVMTGNKIETATDFQHGTSDLLKFERTYMSKTGTWHFSYPLVQQENSIKVLAPVKYRDYTFSSSTGNKVVRLYLSKEIIEFTDSSSKKMAFSKDGNYANYTPITRSVAADSLVTRNILQDRQSDIEFVYSKGLRKEIYSAAGKLKGIEQEGSRLNVQYNASNNSTIYKDSYGNGFVLSPVNGDGKDFSLVDDAGKTILYEFDGEQLKTVTHADGTAMHYVYESLLFPKALTGKVDELGKRLATWAYDAKGKANLTTYAGNAERFDLVYDDANHKVTQTSATGKQTVYWYYPATSANTFNKIKRIEGVPASHCLASDSYFSYDTNGYRKTLTDKNGNVTETLRNSRGLIETQRTGLAWTNGVDSTLAETPTSQKVTTTWLVSADLPVRRTYYGWNGSAYEAYRQEYAVYSRGDNRLGVFTVTDLTTFTVPYATNGRTHQWTYSYSYYDTAQTQLKQQRVDGPRTDVSDITSYNYDTSGNLSSIVNALGHTTTFNDYNAIGLVGNIIDANLQVTAMTYTVRGWLQTLTINGAATSHYDYYANGLLQKVTMPDGSWLRYTYNDARHLVRVENSLGESIDYTASLLDGKWTQETVKDASANIIRQRGRVFDELGRVMTLQGQNGQSWQYSYDKNDNLTSENDALQQLTTYQYDTQNRLSETFDGGQNAKPDTADRNAIAFAYDVQGNVKSITDQRGNTTNYLYDGFGELIQESSPDTEITTFTYDANGNLTGKTDARRVRNNYHYDALNRLIFMGDRTDFVNFEYDNISNGNKGRGQLTGYSSNNLQTALIYDAWGLASSTDCVFTLLCYTTAYNRNLQGQLVSMVYPSGNILHYGYNSIGEVNNIKWQASGQTPAQAAVIANNIVYRPFSGNIKQLHYGNGVQSQFGYDTDGRLQYILAAGNVGELSNKGYQYTPVDNISHINDNVQSINNRSYHYDKNSRLTQDIKGNGDAAKMTSYVYDEVGNRQQKIQAMGEASPVSHETLAYATESNRLLSKDDSVSGSHITYQYNAKGDITAVVASPTGSVNYDYNTLGRMQVSNALAGDITQYTINALGQRQIKMPNGDAALSTWYVYGLDGKILAEHNLETQQVQSEYIYLNGLPIAYVVTKNGSSVIYTVINDHLATPQMLLDNNQNIVWQADYDAFGKISLPIEQVTFNLRFPGQYFDKETGLHYNYYRDYDTSLGRYVQSDPIGLGGGINTFGYVGGNPVNFFDPYGLALCWMSLSGGWLKCVPETSNGSSVQIAVASGNNGGGKKCRNNVDCTAEKGRGPIPLGCWKWTDEKTTKKNGRALIPCPGTDTNMTEQRTLIRSHSCPYPFGPGTGGADGKTFCSEGCITGTEDSIKQMNNLIDLESESTLYVYP